MSHSLISQIAEIRTRQLLTQGQVADRIGVSRGAIIRLEAGHGQASVFTAAIAAMGLTLSGLGGAGSIGARIRRRRIEKGWSQAGLAEKVGVSRATIVSFESTSQIRMESLLRILDQLGVNIRLRQGRSYFAQGHTDAWDTSLEFITLIHSVIPEFDLDPASSRTTSVRAKAHFFQEDDGLTQPWSGEFIWLNPPYDQIAAWVSKVITELDAGHVRTVVALLPVRSNVRYWHVHILGRADVFLLKGRLKFGESRIAAPFASALVVWGGSPDVLSALSRILAARHIPADRRDAA